MVPEIYLFKLDPSSTGNDTIQVSVSQEGAVTTTQTVKTPGSGLDSGKTPNLKESV